MMERRSAIARDRPTSSADEASAPANDADDEAAEDLPRTRLRAISTEESKVWRLKGLVRKSTAPSFIAQTASSTRPNAVMRITGTFSPQSESARRNSSPPKRGI